MEGMCHLKDISLLAIPGVQYSACFSAPLQHVHGSSLVGSLCIVYLVTHKSFGFVAGKLQLYSLLYLGGGGGCGSGGRLLIGRFDPCLLQPAWWSILGQVIEPSAAFIGVWVCERLGYKCLGIEKALVWVNGQMRLVVRKHFGCLNWVEKHYKNTSPLSLRLIIHAA